MIPEIEESVGIMEGIKKEIGAIIQDMKEDELNWTPLSGEVSNSIYALVVHICGSEAYMIHQVVGGRQVKRNRDAEFIAHGESAAELETLMAETMKTTRDILDALTPSQLMETRDTAWGPTKVLSAILRQIHHQALHLGQIQLTKQIYETLISDDD